MYRLNLVQEGVNDEYSLYWRNSNLVLLIALLPYSYQYATIN